MWAEEDVAWNKEDRQREERGAVIHCLTEQHKTGLLEVSIGVLLCGFFLELHVILVFVSEMISAEGLLAMLG